MHRWEPHCSSGASVIALDAFRVRPPMRRRGVVRAADSPAVVALPNPRRAGARALRLEWRPWLALGVWMSSCLIVYVAAVISIVNGQPAAIP